MKQYVITQTVGGEKQYVKMGFMGLGIAGRDEFESVQALSEATRLGRIGAWLWVKRLNEAAGTTECGVEEVER